MKFHLSIFDFIKSPEKLKIIKFLLTHEAPMSEREIASVLKISHMSVNRTLQELSDLNLVHYTTIGKAHQWSVNRKSYTFKVLQKLIDSLEAIPDPLTELKNMILKAIPKTLVERAVVFGSVAQKEERTDSDIDLFVLAKDAQSQKKLGAFIDQLSAVCMDTFGNRLEPYVLNPTQYKQKQKLPLIEAINKGIEVYPG